MKKILCVALILTLVLAATATAFAAPTTTINASVNDAKVTIQARDLNLDNINYNGTLYVPLRAISEEIGLKVLWYPELKIAQIRFDDTLYGYMVLLQAQSSVQYYCTKVLTVAPNLNKFNEKDIQSLKDLFIQKKAEFADIYGIWLESETDTYLSGTYSVTIDEFDQLIKLCDEMLAAKKSSKSLPLSFWSDLDKLIEDAALYGDSLYSVYNVAIQARNGAL